MPSTAFRDVLPAGTAYPLSLERLATLLPGRDFAAYFIATATWARQAAPLQGEALPVLRLQSQAPRLRVRNERMSAEARTCSLHALVYAVPIARNDAITEALAALAPDWLEPWSGQLVLFHEPAGGLQRHATLPSWL